MRRLAASPAFAAWISVALMVLLYLAGAARYTGFASLQVGLNLLNDNAFLLVLAVGMSFVILSGGIDLSVGSVLALTTTGTAWLLQAAHWPPPAVIILALAGGAAFGALQGWLIHAFRLQAFIVTLAGMFLARGLCFMISVDSITIDAPLFVTLSQAQLPVFGSFLSPGAVIALAVLAAGVRVARFTPFGRTVYAIGGNETSALMMGLPVGRTQVAVYALSGLCAATAGLLFAIYMLSGHGQHGQGVELDAIAAVVIGGTVLTGGKGHVAGALSGVLVLGLIQTLIAFDGTLSSWWSRIVVGGLLLVFCLAQQVAAWSARRGLALGAGR
jgi:simple sugar transport system permease protein